MVAARLRKQVCPNEVDDSSRAPTPGGHGTVRVGFRTARYDRRGERAKRKAAGHLRVPYFGN